MTKRSNPKVIKNAAKGRLLIKEVVFWYLSLCWNRVKRLRRRRPRQNAESLDIVFEAVGGQSVAVASQTV